MRTALALVVGAVLTTVAGTASGAATPCGGQQVAKAGGLTFGLTVGPAETMITAVQAKKGMKGEVMAGGKMAGGMSMGMDGKTTRHLEVRVCRAGRPVTAIPVISVADSMGMATKIPVAVMSGASVGVGDTHFGNNVTMTGGQHYTVKVVSGGATATFAVVAKK